MKFKVGLIVLVLFMLEANLNLLGVTHKKLLNDSLSLDLVNESPSRKYTYYFLEAVGQKNIGRMDDAFILFNRCIELNPNSAEAYYQLATLHMNNNQSESGIKMFQTAVALDSLNYWYNESLYFALYSNPARSKEALQHLEKMTERFPSKTALQFQLLESYTQGDQLGKAITVLNRLESQVGKSEQLTLQKFKIYLLMGDEKQAVDEICELIKAYPDDYRYQITLADFYLNKKKYKKAYSTLRGILTKDSDYPLALYSLANYYYETDQKEKYLRQLEKIVGNTKADSDLKLNLIRQLIMKSKGESEQIEPLFQKAIDTNPTDDQILMLYTKYLVSQNKKEETKPVLERIIQLDPTNTPSRLMLLALAIEKDDYTGVIDLCEGGIIASPETIEFYYYLAIAYNQAEEHSKVLDVIDQAIKLTDETTPVELMSDFYAIKGDAYYALGDIKKVYEVYDRALEFSPKNYGVLNNYAYYLSVEGKNLNHAETMSKMTVEAEPKNATFLDTYAWILFQLKKYTQARVFIDTALENGGEASGVIVEHAGDIYYKLGDKDRAVDFWIQADKLGAGSKIKQKIKRKKYIPE